MRLQLFVLLLLSIGLAVALPALPAGPWRVAAIGDSLTEGDGDDTGQGGYPPRLARLLQKNHRGSQVKNFGKSGWTSENVILGHDQEPSELAQALKYRPQVALVWIGSNDLWYLYEYGNPSPAEEKADQRQYERNLNRIIGDLKGAGAFVYIALLDDQARRPVALKGEAFPGTSRSELARMSVQVKAYNQILRQLATRHGAGLVDLGPAGLFTDPRFLSDDGNHPNPAGYDRIAAIWFKALIP